MYRFESSRSPTCKETIINLLQNRGTLHNVLIDQLNICFIQHTAVGCHNIRNPPNTHLQDHKAWTEVGVLKLHLLHILLQTLPHLPENKRIGGRALLPSRIIIHKPEAHCLHFYCYGYHHIKHFSDPPPSTLPEQVTPSKMEFMCQ